MAKLSIIPQQFSFSRQTIEDLKGNTIQPELDIAIRIDAYKADKKQLKR